MAVNLLFRWEGGQGKRQSWPWTSCFGWSVVVVAGLSDQTDEKKTSSPAMVGEGRRRVYAGAA